MQGNGKKILSNRLNWWLESENKLPGSQFGFRRGLLCMNNLAFIYFAEILRGFQTDTPVATIFLDIKAYDNLIDILIFLIDILVNRLTNLDIPPCSAALFTI